jgi:phosphomannomutase
MAPKFGTSGLRGLVEEMTGELIAAHVQAFLRACETGRGLYLGRDLRRSSPRIAGDVRAAARAMGVSVTDCGALPTPALALAAMQAGAGAVMVTGSHIPDDRNGLKFYTPAGEITKADEAAILAALSEEGPDHAENARLETNMAAIPAYVARYVEAFGDAALAGRRIGLYAHSSVGREALKDVLDGLGAEVVVLGWSDHFIPVDTEAVDPQVRAQIAAWVAKHQLDALVSTDGDADRPLLADETGAIVPGDIMGQITAEFLGAETVVTPISSNSGVLHKGFGKVVRTCIGSPYVIAGMEAAGGAVVGYEANGGFLLGFEAQGPSGVLSALLTRDCTLPLVAVLVAAGRGGVAARVAAEPPVITRADRLQDIPTAESATLIARLREDAGARADFLAPLGLQDAALDLTDGLRMILKGGGVLHLRPSGNAPELRVYVEGTDAAAADALLQAALAHVARLLA